MIDIRTLYIISKDDKLSNILYTLITMYGKNNNWSSQYYGKGVGNDFVRPMITGESIWEKGLLHDSEKAIIIGSVASEYDYEKVLIFKEDKYGIKYATSGNLAAILLPEDALCKMMNTQSLYEQFMDELCKNPMELFDNRHKSCNPWAVVITNVLFPGIATAISIAMGISDRFLVSEQMYAWAIINFFYNDLENFIVNGGRYSSVNHIAENNKLAAKKIQSSSMKIDSYLENAVNRYNLQYAELSSAGVALMTARETCAGVLIPQAIGLINSIACVTKEIKCKSEIIKTNKDAYSQRRDYAVRELDAAKVSAFASTGGALVGAAIANLAPNVVSWVATTYGSASVSAAISTFSGAASGTAALAWTGGGALATTAAGSSVCAVAGPIGWAVAGVCILGSVVVFKHKNLKLSREKKEETAYIENNTALISMQTDKIKTILGETTKISEALQQKMLNAHMLAGANYGSLSSEDRLLLGEVVNLTVSLSKLMERTV